MCRRAKSGTGARCDTTKRWRRRCPGSRVDLNAPEGTVFEGWEVLKGQLTTRRVGRPRAMVARSCARTAPEPRPVTRLNRARTAPEPHRTTVATPRALPGASSCAHIDAHISDRFVIDSSLLLEK